MRYEIVAKKVCFILIAEESDNLAVLFSLINFSSFQMNSAMINHE